MTLKSHHLLLLLPVALLGGAFLALPLLEPAASVPPPEEAAAPASRVLPEAPRIARPALRATAAPPSPAPAVASPEGPATVVPTGPGDVVPEPEVASPLPQANDALVPEEPQTPAWRAEKVAHLATLMGRHLPRLEQDLKRARASGDAEEARRLEVAVGRQKDRLKRLQEQEKRLREEAAAGVATGTPP